MPTRSLTCLLACSALAIGQFQTNQPAASLSINGIATAGTTAAVADIGRGSSFTLTISSTNGGQPYDVAVSSQPQLNPGVSFAGQLVNLDFFGAFSFLSGGATFAVLGLPFGNGTWSTSFVNTPTAVGLTTFQMYALDPANPAGIALSQATTLSVNDLQPLFLDDDSFSVQSLATPFTFYGVTYAECYVGSNGFVTFGSGSRVPLALLPGFLEGPPSIRANWIDLDPSAGGSVLFLSEFSTGMTTVSFVNVPEWRIANSNSFSTTFGGDLVTMTYSAIQNPDALVGLSPGGSLAPGVAVDLSTAPGAPITLDPSSAPYQRFFGGNDLNGLTLRWALNGSGAPLMIF